MITFVSNDRRRTPHPLKPEICKRGLKQQDIAVALSVSPSDLSRWLNHGQIMPGPVAIAIQALLDSFDHHTQHDA